MQTTTDQLARRLAALCKDYLVKQADWLEQLRKEARVLRKAKSPAAAREPLTVMGEITHRLSGSSGTFGFEGVGQQARQLGALVDFLAEDGSAPSPEQCAEIDWLVDALASQIERARADDMAMPASWSGRSGVRGSGTDSAKRVLIVEDDENERRHLEAHLVAAGVAVRAMSDPNELTAAVEDFAPDVVILDLMYPGDRSAGMTALARFAAGDGRRVPVVVLSARDDLEARIAAIRAGCAAYLLKPAEIDDVFAALSWLVPAEGSDPFRVLVVDDEAEPAEYYAALLEDAGFDIRTVNDPSRTLTELAAFQPDILLMDINMPGYTGLEIAAAIRQNPTYLHLPVVFLTAEEGPDKKLLAMRSGGDDFFTKPVAPEALIAAVASRARRSRLMTSLAGRKRESEARFRAFAEAASDWLWESDVAGRVTYLSDRFARSTGNPLDSVLGRRLDEIGRLLTDEPASRDAQADFAAHAPFRNLRMEVDGPNGARHMLVSGVPVLSEDGAFRGYRGSGTDVTDHESDMAAAMDNTNLLQVTIKNMVDGVSVLDRDLKIVSFNDAVRKMYDLPDGLLKVGKSVETIFRYNAERGDYGPGDIEQQVAERMALARRAEAHAFELTRSDGRTIFVRGNPVPGGGFVTLYTDVTDQRKAEQAVKDSEERLRVIAETAPVPIVITRMSDGTVLFANPQLGLALGYDPDGVVGLPAPDFYRNPERRARLIEALAARGAVDGMEIDLKHAGGETVPVLVSARIIEFDGEPAVVSGMLDITDRKKAEAELADYRDHLEDLVVERTDELARKATELERALLKEKEVNEQQRQFVSMASHEFRTPLTIIDGTAQRILRRKEGIDASDLEKRVGKIRDAVTRMQGLIESTLSASRMDAGKIEMNRTRLDLAALVNEVCKRQQSIAPKHRIEVDLSGLDRPIFGDPKLLDQVFTNLLSNAVKYAPDDPRIRIVGRIDGADAVVSVRDGGVGIPADELPRMFQRFFRASTSTGIAGTGIGLTVVKKFVDMHGGRVDLESEEGMGTTFTIVLPVDLRQDDAARAEPRVKAGPKAVAG